MNTLCNQIYEILRSELSNTTAGIIIEQNSRAIGKDSDTITVEDIKNLIRRILLSVFLFGGMEKAKRIKDKFDGIK